MNSLRRITIRTAFTFLQIVSFSLLKLLYAQPHLSIDKEDLKEHVYYLASPQLEGRNTGEPGQKSAARYIDSIFREAGLLPLREDTYYQPFSLYKSTREKIEFTGKQGYVTAWSLINPGIKIPDNATFLFSGNQKIPLEKNEARDKFIILIPKNTRMLNRMIKHYSHADPIGYLIVMESNAIAREIRKTDRREGSLRLERQPGATKFNRFDTSSGAPIMSFIKPSQFTRLFGMSTEDIINQNGNSRFKEIVKLSPDLKMRRIPGTIDSIMTENIIGMIEGTSRKEEYIIVTAHYDHIGKHGDKINAGADDNASGTAALLEMAEGMAKLKASGFAPERSVIFASVSAEELGLFGSKYFVNSPEFKDKNGVLNINMDMIGKSIRYEMIETFKLQGQGNFMEDTTLRESYVYLLKKGRGTRKLAKESQKSARGYKPFIVDQRPGFLVRITYKHSSDHKNFYTKGIPILVYFTGLHPDYHTPGDTPEKIDYENMTKITNIIFQTLISGANP